MYVWGGLMMILICCWVKIRTLTDMTVLVIKASMESKKYNDNFIKIQINTVQVLYTYTFRFDVYGGRLHIHDIIICYLDLDSGLVSFQKNDEFLGECLLLISLYHLTLTQPFSGMAYKLDKRSKESPFFPHICVKNTEVFVNFGQKPPTFKPPPGFIFIAHLHGNNLVHNPVPSRKPQVRNLLNC